MSFVDEHKELATRFNTETAADNMLKDLGIEWPNMTFKPSSDKSWMRFNILDVDTKQITFGDIQNIHRAHGLVIVQVFSPLNIGDSEAMTIADAVAKIFRNWCGTTVRCREAAKRVIGPDGHGWYQVNVIVPFQRDELL